MPTANTFLPADATPEEHDAFARARQAQCVAIFEGPLADLVVEAKRIHDAFPRVQLKFAVHLGDGAWRAWSVGFPDATS